MESKREVCVNCYQGITNPICEKCRTKQLAIWLNDAEIDPSTTTKIIRKIRENLSFNYNNESLCILCGSELITICTYCYFFKVDRILRSLNLTDETIEEFLQLFNYRLYHAFFRND